VPNANAMGFANAQPILQVMLANLRYVLIAS
jgi:hypothetical protein